MADYYSILGINKSATTDEVKKAFKKLALMYHPDKHRNATEEEKKQFSKKFMEVKQAYDVLSDEKKRKNYDTYGSEEPFGGGGNFNPNDFFSGGSKFKSTFNFQSNFNDFFPGGSPFDNPFFKGETNYRKKEKEVTEVNFRCTLDELFKGCNKELKIQRHTLRGTETVNLRLTVKPGYKKGTKFTFRDYGDQMSDGSYKDIKAVLNEAEDPSFRRVNDDLLTVVQITFKDLFKGFTKTLSLPGGRNYTITEKDVKTIGGESVIPFMGMPVQNNISTKGALRITFVMGMPLLSSDQKERILSLL